MSILAKPDQAIPDAQEILGAFGECARLNAFMEGHYFNGTAEFHRQEVIASVAEKIMGRSVLIVETPHGKAQKERPIDLCSQGNDSLIETYKIREQEKYRRYKGDKHPYIPRVLFLQRKKVRGKVVGIDEKRASLVIKPRGPGRIFSRYWVRMADEEGVPLVGLNIRG